MTKRRVKFGVLPTENMPKKSHETPKPPSRPHREIVKDGPTTVKIRRYYKGLEDVCKRIKCLKSICEWTVEQRSDRVVLQKMKECFQLPEFDLIIDDILGYIITVYGWFLPEDHELYTRSLRSVNNVTVSDLLRDIESRPVCPGVSPNELSGQVIPHVVPKVVDPLYCSNDEGGFDMFPKKQFWRPIDCSVLCSPQSQLCTACTEYLHASDLKARAKQRRLSEPAHIKAPVASTAPERLKLTLQMQTLKCSELEHQLEEMKEEITKSSVMVDHELNNDLTSIISDCGSSMTPFMNLFCSSRKGCSKAAQLVSGITPWLYGFAYRWLQSLLPATKNWGTVKFLCSQVSDAWEIIEMLSGPKEDSKKKLWRSCSLKQTLTLMYRDMWSSYLTRWRSWQT